MNNTRNAFALLGTGIVIGAILTVILVYSFGAQPKTIAVGPVEFEMPTQPVVQAPKMLPTVLEASTEVTSLASLPSPTYTPVVSPTATPTITPIPTPTPDPRLFWDDFETGIKPDWNVVSGRCTMVDGTLKCPVVPARFEVGSNDWADYRLEFDTGSYWNYHEGVVVMVKLAQDGSHLSLHLPPCSNAVWTYADSQGNEEHVADTKGGACANDPVHVIIECAGNLCTTMMNGKVVSTFQEARAPRGRIGFYTDMDGTWFDNVSVSAIK